METTTIKPEALTFAAYAEKGSDGRIRVVASTDRIDRDRRSIHPTGIDVSNYARNPVLGWNHNLLEDDDALPIGKATEVAMDGGRLTFVPDFAPTPQGQTLKALYDGGYLTSWSVGVMPTKVTFEEADGGPIKHIESSELYEISAVNIPSNPDATVLVAASLRGVGLEGANGEGAVATEDQPSSDAEPELTSSAGEAEPAPTPEASTETPSGNDANTAEVEIEDTTADEVRALLNPDSASSEAAAAQAASTSGEGSAPEQVSGLTTRQQHAERVARTTALVTEQVYRRLTGRLP